MKAASLSGTDFSVRLSLSSSSMNLAHVASDLEPKCRFLDPESRESF